MSHNEQTKTQDLFLFSVRKIHLWPFFFFFSLLSLFPDFSWTDDWPSWRGPDRNGISKENGWDPKKLERGVGILWRIKLAEGYSSVSVWRGLLYTMGNMDGRDIVYCLEERTGREVWRFSYDSAAKSYHGTFSSPVIDGGCVYSSGRNGDVHCLDAKTGKRIWHTNVVEKYGAQIPKYGFSGSPVIEGRAVILNACLYGIALDKATGKKIWASPPGRAGYATPVVYDYEGKKGIVVFSHRRLNGVDLRTGERLWQFPWIFNDGADSPDPVVVGSRVFISTAYRNGGAMIEFTGNRPEQHWFKKEIQNEFGSSLYIDGYLYVPVGDTRHRTAYLKCIDFNSGEELWSRDTGHCSMIYADGKFIVLNQWGKLRIMEATDKGWTDLSEADIIETNSRVRCWTAPVLANGRIYVRTCVGDLVCVDVSSSQSSGPITK